MKPTIESKILTIYFCILCFVFPLFFTNFYYNIQISKCLFFIITTYITLVCLILFSSHKNFTLRFIDIFKTPGLLYAFAFCIFALISSCLSPYGRAAFTGENGRYIGFVTILSMCICFFLFSRQFIDLKPYYIFFFAGSFIVELLGILQFIDLDILGFSFHVPEHLTGAFLSTIGNNNVFSNYVSLATAFCIGIYCLTPKKYFLLLSLVGYTALFIGNSDGGFLGIMVVLLILPLLYPHKTNPIICILDQLFTFSTACAISWGLSFFAIVPYVGLPKFFSNPSFFLPLCAVIILFRFCYTKWIFAKINRFMFKKIYGYILICIVAIIILLFTAANLHIISIPALLMTDNWGSNRGFIWRKVIQLYLDAPILQKIFGYGPDTLKTLMINTSYNEMISVTGMIYDSAHNSILHYLITTGFTGVIAWIAYWINIVVYSVKSARNDILPWLMALIAYLVHSMLLPNQPITDPLAFMIAGICIGLAKKNRDVK